MDTFGQPGILILKGVIFSFLLMDTGLAARPPISKAESEAVATAVCASLQVHVNCMHARLCVLCPAIRKSMTNTCWLSAHKCSSML